jgi:hypothetical protein
MRFNVRGCYAGERDFHEVDLVGTSFGKVYLDHTFYKTSGETRPGVENELDSTSFAR